MVGVGNGLILDYLMYQSGRVPRGMAMLGLMAGPLVCLSGIAVVTTPVTPEWKRLPQPGGVCAVYRIRTKLAAGLRVVSYAGARGPVRGGTPCRAASRDERSRRYAMNLNKGTNKP